MSEYLRGIARFCVVLAYIAGIGGLQAKVNENNQKYGGSLKIGINFSHLSHKAGESWSSGLHTALFGDYFYTFKNGFVLGTDGTIGASISNLVNGRVTPLSGAEHLTTYRPRGLLGLISDGGFYAGYYFIRREADKPLYVGIGIFANTFSNQAAYVAIGSISSFYLPIEIRGDLRFNAKWGLEYLASYDARLFSSVRVIGTALASNASLSIKEGYALRFNFGVRYYISEQYYFSMTLIARYESLGASTSAMVSNVANTDTPGVIDGASALVHYPRSSTSYVGIRFGFGF